MRLRLLRTSTVRPVAVSGQTQCQRPVTTVDPIRRLSCVLAVEDAGQFERSAIAELEHDFAAKLTRRSSLAAIRPDFLDKSAGSAGEFSQGFAVLSDNYHGRRKQLSPRILAASSCAARTATPFSESGYQSNKGFVTYRFVNPLILPSGMRCL